MMDKYSKSSQDRNERRLLHILSMMVERMATFGSISEEKCFLEHLFRFPNGSMMIGENGLVVVQNVCNIHFHAAHGMDTYITYYYYGMHYALLIISGKERIRNKESKFVLLAEYQNIIHRGITDVLCKNNVVMKSNHPLKIFTGFNK